MTYDPRNKRDSLGRITPDPSSPRPFAEWKTAPSNRDGRSERRVQPRRDGEPTISFRIPERVNRALRLVAQQRGITVTALVQEALIPVLLPVLQAPKRLYDQAPSMSAFLGQNRRLQRLEGKIPSPVKPLVPAYDHVGRQQQRQQKRQRKQFGGHLVDKPQR